MSQQNKESLKDINMNLVGLEETWILINFAQIFLDMNPRTKFIVSLVCVWRTQAM